MNQNENTCDLRSSVSSDSLSRSFNWHFNVSNLKSNSSLSTSRSAI